MDRFIVVTIMFIGLFSFMGANTLHEACFYALSGIPFIWIASRLLNETKETKKYILVVLHYLFYGTILYLLGRQGEMEDKIIYSVIWVAICTIPIYVYEQSGSYLGK